MRDLELSDEAMCNKATASHNSGERLKDDHPIEINLVKEKRKSFQQIISLAAS
jgi:hypothetical protein